MAERSTYDKSIIVNVCVRARAQAAPVISCRLTGNFTTVMAVVVTSVAEHFIG